MIGIHGVNDGGTLRDFVRQQGVRRDSHPVLEFLHPLHRLRCRGKRLLHGLINIMAWIQHGILFQIPAGNAAGKGRRAAVRLGLPAQNAQQCCFSRPVGANDANAVSPFHPGGNAAQYLMDAEALAQIL